MTYIVVILILFFTSNPVQAQEFTTYINNPILERDSDGLGIYQPFVSKKDNQFSLWFADSVEGKTYIKTSKSANGIDWYDKKILQLNSYRVSDPFVLESNGEYQLYYSSYDAGTYSIWKSVSNNNTTFTPGQEILKATLPWEGTNVSCASVLQDQSLEYLLYAASGTSGWVIAMATSPDGQNWHKCDNNPIATGSQSHIVKYKNEFYLFYQDSTGLRVKKTEKLNGCETVWSDARSISVPFGNPSPVVVGDDLWLYGDYGTNKGVVLGLAGTIQIPEPKYPIVIVPGMFASWNREAILHNVVMPISAWKVLPAITEYDALEGTLEAVGRIKDKDYFVFPYDWRKSIEETTNNLDSFLNATIWNTHPYLPVQLIGHSLGGVVVRQYAQNSNSKPIKNIVTAGSSHLGAVQAYKPLAGGEIDRENTLMWIAEKLIVLLNKSKIENDKDTITRMLPVLNGLLPTFPYLKNVDGAYIDSSFINTTLSNKLIDSSISQLYLGGTGHETKAGYVLSPRTTSDILFNLYSDGHPVSSWQEDGDGLVLSRSSLNQISPPITANHGEIIYSKESIRSILLNLHIPFLDSNISDGRGTSIFPAILAFIQSPATIQIIHNNKTVDENEGMIYIQNAENGNYSLKVIGQSTGEYTVSVWLIGENDDKWVQFKKETGNGKTDEYRILFDTNTGGTALEYILPNSTPTPPPSLTPSPSVISTPSSSSTSSSNSSPSSNNHSTQSTNSENVKTNTISSSLLTQSIKTFTDKSLPKQSFPLKKINTPHVLGATTTSKDYLHFSFAELLFLKQILWGVYVAFYMAYKRIIVIYD